MHHVLGLNSCTILTATNSLFQGENGNSNGQGNKTHYRNVDTQGYSEHEITITLALYKTIGSFKIVVFVAFQLLFFHI